VYGILGDDKSDVETLKVLVKRLADNQALPVKTKGYGGCANMLRKGAKQLVLFRDLACTRFIVCYDADGPDPKPKHELVRTRIVEPSGIDKGVCIVIPVQEIEAWILADIECATEIFTSWNPKPINNPEQISSPKEYLEKLSRDSRQKPRYSHATHNERMAKYIDLRKVCDKCSAFRVLAKFVTGKSGWPE
jgi:hypothetical protein